MEAERLNGRKTKDDDLRRWNLHLSPFFAKCKALDVTRPMIREYIAQRKTEKDFHGNFPRNATINRELSVLREAYTLALKDERLRHAPSFKGLLLDESDNVRKGFLKDHQYEALARETAKIGLWFRSIFEIYYCYGWRLNEPLGMRVRLLDFEHRTITIEDSKNGDGRTVAMTQKVFELLKACCEGKGEDDYVFTREDGNTGLKLIYETRRCHNLAPFIRLFPRFLPSDNAVGKLKMRTGTALCFASITCVTDNCATARSGSTQCFFSCRGRGGLCPLCQQFLKPDKSVTGRGMETSKVVN